MTRPLHFVVATRAQDTNKTGLKVPMNDVSPSPRGYQESGFASTFIGWMRDVRPQKVITPSADTCQWTAHSIAADLPHSPSVEINDGLQGFRPYDVAPGEEITPTDLALLKKGADFAKLTDLRKPLNPLGESFRTFADRMRLTAKLLQSAAEFQEQLVVSSASGVLAMTALIENAALTNEDLLHTMQAQSGNLGKLDIITLHGNGESVHQRFTNQGYVPAV